MRLRISAWQSLIILLGAIIGGGLGFALTPTYHCITAPCPQPSLTIALILGAAIGAAVAYAALVGFNSLKR